MLFETKVQKRPTLLMSRHLLRSSRRVTFRPTARGDGAGCSSWPTASGRNGVRTTCKISRAELSGRNPSLTWNLTMWWSCDQKTRRVAAGHWPSCAAPSRVETGRCAEQWWRLLNPLASAMFAMLMLAAGRGRWNVRLQTWYYYSLQNNYFPCVCPMCCHEQQIILSFGST